MKCYACSTSYKYVEMNSHPNANSIIANDNGNGKGNGNGDWKEGRNVRENQNHEQPETPLKKKLGRIGSDSTTVVRTKERQLFLEKVDR